MADIRDRNNPLGQGFRPLGGGEPGPDPTEIVTGATAKVRGRVFKGTTHYHAIEEAAKALKVAPSRLFKSAKMGFSTSKGRVITREEAYKLADMHDQIRNDSTGLTDKRHKTISAESLKRPGEK